MAATLTATRRRREGSLRRRKLLTLAVTYVALIVIVAPAVFVLWLNVTLLPPASTT